MTRTLLTATVGLALASLSGCCYTPGRVILSCETNVDCPGGYTGRRVTIGIFVERILGALVIIGWR